MTFPYGLLQTDPLRRAIEEAIRLRAYELPRVTVEAREPNTLERIGSFMVNEERARRPPGAVATTTDVFLGNLVRPFSSRAATMATDESLRRFTEGGGDPDEAKRIGRYAGWAGSIVGNVGASRVIPPVTKAATLSANIARGAYAGAAENAAVGGAGALLFGDEASGSRDPMDVLKQMAGQAAVGAGFGAVVGGVAGAIRGRGTPNDLPEMRSQTSGEAVRGSQVFAQVPEAQPAGVVRGAVGHAPTTRPMAEMVGDDLMARRVGLPDDLRSDLRLLAEEQEWMKLQQDGARVRLPTGEQGVVRVDPAREAKFPRNSVTDDVVVYVTHDRFGDALPEARATMASPLRLESAEAAAQPARTGGLGRAGIIRLPASREPAGTPYKAPIDVSETPSGEGPALANLKKLNLSPEAEAKVRDAYTRLGLDKRRVSWDETKAAADELGLNPRKLLDKSGRLRADEALAVRDVISQNARRMVDLATEKAKAGTDEDRLFLQAQINGLSEETDQFLKRYSLERNRAGRDLNALKMVARESMEPAVWMSQAQRVKGPLALTSDEGIRITQLASANDRDGLIRFVASLHRSTILDRLLAVWKAGLLMNPLPHAVNITSNVAMAGAETAKEVPATAIDAVISAVRGTERTKSISLRGLLTEQVRGIGPGAKAALRVLRYGDSPEQLAKWDFRQTNFGEGPGGRILQAYTDGVFRSLSAEDQLFKGAALGRTMEEYARLEAKRMVKEGTAKTVDAALTALRGNLPPELVAKAIADAEVATFQQPNLIASMISGGRRALLEHGKLGEVARAGTEVVMPFVRTPTNIANTLVQYSPAGLVTALVKQIGDPSQKRLAEDLGRTLTGSTLVALGFMLAREGKATGASPQSAAERSQWDLEGKQANSVRIGDRWVAVSRLAPIGALVSVGAQMYHGAAEAESMSGKVATAAYTPLRVTLDQPFVTGIQTTLEALQEPGRAGERFVERQAGSLVPAGVAAIARGTDPNLRDPQGILEAMAARIPGLSRTVEPRLDPFGQPMPSRGGVVKQLTDVTYSREASDDPLIQELARLGVTVGFPSRQRTVQEGAVTRRESRSADEYRAFLEEVGPETRSALEAVLGHPQFARMDDETKRETLESQISAARQLARSREAARLQQRR